MQLKYRFILFLILIISPVCVENNVLADVLNSDWIGTLDKSYEMAWQQENSKQYNSYGTEFFLEYTYINRNNKNYPTYCVEYYLKGPDNSNEYGKTKLLDMQLPQSVSNGLIYILKNGYPNVKRPYGTADASEAYYATSAAVHIWTMYYGVDELAGNDLGWFQYKDGFIMNKSKIEKYITDYSTKSTASGWHVIGANNNESSKRTWVATMKLLYGAINAETLNPCLTIKESEKAHIDEDYVVYKYRIDSKLCENIRLHINANIDDVKYEYKNNQDYTIATLYIPKDKVKSSQVFDVYASADIIGYNNPENYYYLYHLTGSYQSMVYADSDASRAINSNKLKLTIPELKSRVYYDLNYSGSNYIKGGNFKNPKSTSYNGSLSYKVTGNVDYFTYGGDSSYSYLNMTYTKPGDINNCIYFNTLLPSSSDDGFISNSVKLMTFSCWIKVDKATTFNLCFGNSVTKYEIKINDVNEWQFINLRLIKNETDNNYLYLYPQNAAVIDIYNPQLEDGSVFTKYCAENSPKASPTYTEHNVGATYNSIYNGIAPTRENYIFLGWNTQKNGKGCYVNNSQIASSGDIVLYAIWTQKPVYNVYLHYGTNGGEHIKFNNLISYGIDGTCIIQVDNHSTFDLSNISGFMEGWEHVGWTYEFGLREDPEPYIVNEVYIDGADVHLYANYKKSYKIYYHYYDELSQSEEIISTVEKTTYNNYKLYAVTSLPKYNGKMISIPEVTDYNLKGWSVTENEYSIVDYVPGELISFSQYEHYYAVYEKNIYVEFYDNNYDLGSNSIHKDASGLHCRYDLVVGMNSKGKIDKATFALPENVCHLENYDFYGWSDKPEFNGSILYYSNDKNIQVETEESMIFYGLYAKTNSVVFIDYDFANGSSHVENTLNAYTYVNYMNKIYSPEIRVPNCCICYDGWDFDGWSEHNDVHDAAKFMTGDEMLVYDDIYLFATYKGDINVNCHTLFDVSGILNEKIDEIDISCEMNSSGAVDIAKVLLPEIHDFTYNNKAWVAKGYSDISSSSDIITHTDNETYIFDKNIDLYAVYNNEINVSFYDYDEVNKKSVNWVDDYYSILTCDMLIKPARLIFPSCISEDYHMNSGWNNDIDCVDMIMNYSGDVLEIYENASFYGLYIDTYVLTCNDLDNDSTRTTKYSSESYKNYNGIIYNDELIIPNQGSNNTIYKPSGYWNTGNGFDIEYISGDKICLSEDITLNSIYIKDIEVIFDSNGGSFSDGSTEIIKNDSLKYNVSGKVKLPLFVTEEIPVKNAYEFTETWNTEKESNGREYFHGEAIITEENLRIYAIWKKALKPSINVIDRYFFVGDEIDYDKVVSKIIKINPYNIPGDEIKIVKINEVDTVNVDNSDIPLYIDSSEPNKYRITVDYIVRSEIIRAEFDLYVVENKYMADRLRYISDYYLDTLAINSKWKLTELDTILSDTLKRQKEDAEYKYTIKKRD